MGSGSRKSHIAEMSNESVAVTLAQASPTAASALGAPLMTMANDVMPIASARTMLTAMLNLSLFIVWPFRIVGHRGCEMSIGPPALTALVGISMRLASPLPDTEAV